MPQFALTMSQLQDKDFLLVEAASHEAWSPDLRVKVDFASPSAPWRIGMVGQSRSYSIKTPKPLNTILRWQSERAVAGHLACKAREVSRKPLAMLSNVVIGRRRTWAPLAVFFFAYLWVQPSSESAGLCPIWVIAANQSDAIKPTCPGTRDLHRRS